MELDCRIRVKSDSCRYTQFVNANEFDGKPVTENSDIVLCCFNIVQFCFERRTISPSAQYLGAVNCAVWLQNFGHEKKTVLILAKRGAAPRAHVKGLARQRCVKGLTSPLEYISASATSGGKRQSG
jgi:hypothetical protein